MKTTWLAAAVRASGASTAELASFLEWAEPHAATSGPPEPEEGGKKQLE